jgi:hypothetical protein
MAAEPVILPTQRDVRGLPCCCSGRNIELGDRDGYGWFCVATHQIDNGHVNLAVRFTLNGLATAGGTAQLITERPGRSPTCLRRETWRTHAGTGPTFPK